MKWDELEGHVVLDYFLIKLGIVICDTIHTIPLETNRSNGMHTIVFNLSGIGDEWLLDFGCWWVGTGTGGSSKL